jgi:hypothetical protein
MKKPYQVCFALDRQLVYSASLVLTVRNENIFSEKIAQIAEAHNEK